MRTSFAHTLKILFAVLLLTRTVGATAQVDTVGNAKGVKYAHSPKKAAILSAILPGAGQLYNKKWWKVPIVYAALGTSTGFIIYNQRKYTLFKDAYVNRLANPTEVNEFSQYSTSNLFDIQDTYHNWRDISIVVTSAFYVLNILDATVDAHFFRYDVSDDLSIEVSPSLNFVKPGLNICLRF